MSRSLYKIKVDASGKSVRTNRADECIIEALENKH
jgi:hypothetical protein